MFFAAGDRVYCARYEAYGTVLDVNDEGNDEVLVQWESDGRITWVYEQDLVEA
jgi:hypothetical protein